MSNIIKNKLEREYQALDKLSLKGFFEGIAIYVSIIKKDEFLNEQIENLENKYNQKIIELKEIKESGDDAKIIVEYSNFDKSELNSLYGAWMKMLIPYNALKKEHSIDEFTVNNDEKINYDALLEITRQSVRFTNVVCNGKKDDKNEFNREDYFAHITQIHNFLISTLEQITKPLNKDLKGNVNKFANIEKVPLPKGVDSWDRVILRLSGEDGIGDIIVEIKVDDKFEYKTDIEKLGLRDMRSPDKMKGKECWNKFFYVAAMNDGKYLLGRRVLNSEKEKERGRVHKWKQEIKEKFMYVFDINEDPVRWNKEKEEFILAMTVTVQIKDRVEVREYSEIEEFMMEEENR